jgi:uncharacterized membrane protein YdjX (TVP38/TMEM64 family)
MLDMRNWFRSESPLHSFVREHFLAIVVLLFLFLIYQISFPYLTSGEARDFVAAVGVWGYLIVASYTVLAHIFAPLTGSPALLISVTLYGVNTAMNLLYLASLVSSIINFWISRKYGRGVVVRLVGKKALKEIDEFTKVEGTVALIYSRLFGFSLFDFVSYGFGLTSMSFRKYFLITVIASAIPNLAIRYVFRFIDTDSSYGISIWFVMILLSAGVFAILIKRYINLKQKGRCD